MTTTPKIHPAIFWIPRIVSIAFILFLSLFSLDVFEMTQGFWQTTGALLMHNIPSFVAIIVLLIAWRYEIVGAVTFILAGILYILQMLLNAQAGPFEWYMLSYSLIIAGPAILIGILFLIGWIRKRRPV